MLQPNSASSTSTSATGDNSPFGGASSPSTRRSRSKSRIALQFPTKRCEKPPGARTMWEVLEDNEERKLFKKFAMEEMSHDNIEFWELVQQWKYLTKDPDAQKTLKQQIYQQYIAASGATPLNLAYKVRVELDAKFKLEESSFEKDLQLFTTALNCVEADMVDIFLRFKQSDVWYDHCESYEKLHPSTGSSVMASETKS